MNPLKWRMESWRDSVYDMMERREGVGRKKDEKKFMNKRGGGYGKDVLYMFLLQVEVVTKAVACARKLNILFFTANSSNKCVARWEEWKRAKKVRLLQGTLRRYSFRL